MSGILLKWMHDDLGIRTVGTTLEQVLNWSPYYAGALMQ
jgi:hypothetical protein